MLLLRARSPKQLRPQVQAEWPCEHYVPTLLLDELVRLLLVIVRVAASC